MNADESFSYSHWTGTSLQLRPLWGNFQTQMSAALASIGSWFQFNNTNTNMAHWPTDSLFTKQTFDSLVSLYQRNFLTLICFRVISPADNQSKLQRHVQIAWHGISWPCWLTRPLLPTLTWQQPCSGTVAQFAARRPSLLCRGLHVYCCLNEPVKS